MRLMLVTDKTWHNSLFDKLNSNLSAEWVRVRDKSKFTYEFCKSYQPDWIFIPHWSHIIPSEIHENFRCVVFHMTDLPYGRGGSPLQNLIALGHKETMISAISVAEEIDAGEVYQKKALSLFGTAEEIFINSAKIIENMIIELVLKEPTPKSQKGEVVKFKRRNSNDSDISKLKTIEDIYDYIRMLDCEGYPKAYLEMNDFKLEFNRASLKADKSIIADVRISKK